jgi:prepilin peptidase CpaA
MMIGVISVLAKAGIIIVLAYVASSDFTTQKIRNQQLLYLVAGAVMLTLLRYLQGSDLHSMLISAAIAAVLFAVLFIFGLVGKVGAGDVKLLGIVPLIVGVEGSLTFMAGLLVLTFATYFAMMFPILVPQAWFRTYLTGLGKTGRVPFGVPISIAAIVALLIPLSIMGPPHPGSGSSSLFSDLSISPADLVAKR